MVTLNLGLMARISGGDDLFLTGIADMELVVGGTGLVLYTGSSSGGAGVASYALNGGKAARTGFASFEAGAVVGQETALSVTAFGDSPVLFASGVGGGAGVWSYRLGGNGAVALGGQMLPGQSVPATFANGATVWIGAQEYLCGTQTGATDILIWEIGATGKLSGGRTLSTGLSAGPQGIVATVILPDPDNPLMLMLTDGEDILSGYRISATGQPELTGRHSQTDGLGVGTPSALRVATEDGHSYAIVAASGSSTLTVFEVSPQGGLIPTDHLLDAPDTRFGHVTHLDTAVLGRITYVLASGDEDGFSLFQLLPGGRLLHLLSRADTLAATLADVSAQALTAVEDRLAIVIASSTAPGLTWLEYTPAPLGVTLHGGDAAATLSGTAFDDVLAGGAGAESLAGGAGDDILMDGDGRDVMDGGQGADIFILAADGVPDQITGFEPGKDRLDLSDWAFLRNAGQLTITELNDGARISFGNEELLITTRDGKPLTADAIRAIDVLDGDRLLASWLAIQGIIDPSPVVTTPPPAETLVGSMQRDLLQGGAGNDTILALNGDDWLDGGSGADLMNGGPGSDEYIVNNIDDRVVESPHWAGHDLVRSDVDFWLKGTHVEDLTLSGNADTRAVGNGLANILVGNDGDNILDGGKNNDTLLGGLGDDIYLVRAPLDTVIESPGEGKDTVRAFRSYQIPENVEQMSLMGTAAINGIGNTAGNLIVGNMNNNVLIGREGNDTLRGQGGADTFVFDRSPGPDNLDQIVDFTTGEDSLWIKGTLTGLSPGASVETFFHRGLAAADAADRLIYDQISGTLWLDPDGTGPAAAVAIAVLQGHPVLVADDIRIF